MVLIIIITARRHCFAEGVVSSFRQNGTREAYRENKANLAHTSHEIEINKKLKLLEMGCGIANFGQESVKCKPPKLANLGLNLIPRTSNGSATWYLELRRERPHYYPKTLLHENVARLTNQTVA